VLVVTRLLFKDGIQLNGLPASPAEFTDAYLPFHPAGRPFHHSQPHPRRLNTSHRHITDGCFVSVPEPRLSSHALYGRCSSAWWAEFPQVPGHPEPSASSPAPIDNEEIVRNKNFGTYARSVCLVSKYPLMFIRSFIVFTVSQSPPYFSPFRNFLLTISCMALRSKSPSSGKYSSTSFLDKT